MSARCGDDLRGIRDRAILVFGWWTALRREELSALTVADLERRIDGGWNLHLRRSKDDQEAEGRLLIVARKHSQLVCPVHTTEEWIRASQLEDGALWRRIDRHGRVGQRLSGASIARVVQQAVERTGRDSSQYAAHSLRAGFVTEGFSRGLDSVAIAAQTGHRSLDGLREYYRPDNPAKGNAAALMEG